MQATPICVHVGDAHRGLDVTGGIPLDNDVAEVTLRHVNLPCELAATAATCKSLALLVRRFLRNFGSSSVRRSFCSGTLHAAVFADVNDYCCAVLQAAWANGATEGPADARLEGAQSHILDWSAEGGPGGWYTDFLSFGHTPLDYINQSGDRPPHVSEGHLLAQLKPLATAAEPWTFHLNVTARDRRAGRGHALQAYR